MTKSITNKERNTRVKKGNALIKSMRLSKKSTRALKKGMSNLSAQPGGELQQILTIAEWSKISEFFSGVKYAKQSLNISSLGKNYEEASVTKNTDTIEPNGVNLITNMFETVFGGGQANV